MVSIDAEVGIVGTGTLGSMLAWRLAERGVEALAFERYSPGHDRGAVGGETRLFRMAYAEGADYLPLLVQTLPLWRELEQKSGLPILDQCGGLSIGNVGQPVMDTIQRTAAGAGVAAEVLDRREMAQRYPQHALAEDEFAIYDPAAGQLNADLAVLAAAGRAQAGGATILSGHQVLQVKEHGGYVEIVTSSQTFRVRQAVICAGAWSRQFLPASLAKVLEPRRVPLTWFAARDPQAYRPDRFPVFIRVSDGQLMYGGPSSNGAHVKIGGIRPARPLTDPDHRDRTLDEGELADAVAAIGRYFPGLNPYPVRADAYPDLFANEHRPIFGRLGDSRITAAVAGSGRTFKFAPAVAELLAAQLSAQDVPVQSDALSRFVPAYV